MGDEITEKASHFLQDYQADLNDPVSDYLLPIFPSES